eukprot:286751_1
MGALCCAHNRQTIKSTDDEQAALTGNDEDDKINLSDIEMGDTPELEYPGGSQPSPLQGGNVINNHRHLYMCDEPRSCPSVLNIGQIIKYYLSWISKRSKHKHKDKGMHHYIHKTFPETYHQYNYSHVSLINDFNHILFKHKHEMDIIIDSVFNTRQLNADTHHFILTRIHCNRSPFEECIKMYFGYQESAEICTQQLCDKIYCFLFHNITSFQNDINIEHKDEHDERQQSDEMNALIHSHDSEDEEDEYIHMNTPLLQIQKQCKARKVLYQKMRGLDRISDKNKFFTNIQPQMNNHLGFRYYYWSYYRDNTDADMYNIGYQVSDWYITNKHVTLKEELLSASIPLQLFDLLLKSAINYLGCDHCKQHMICNTARWETQYNIIKGSEITASHLICVLLWCNHDSFRASLCDTYHRISGEETDVALKERHSHFYYVGKYLREIVECFGGAGTSANESQSIWYHAIHDSLVFDSRNNRIKWPMSVTNKYEVIYLNTETEHGLILELVSDTNYFDCQWISDFVYENDKLLIGGLTPLVLNTIICIKHGVCHDYSMYWNALYIIKQVMSGCKHECKDVKMQSVVRKLITNKMYSVYTDCGSLPMYIDKATNAYFSGLDRVNINYKLVTEKAENGGYAFLKPLLLQSNEDNSLSFVNLDIFQSLFACLKEMVIDFSECRDEECCVNSAVFEYVLLHLKALNEWNEISICLGGGVHEEAISEVIDLYKDQFGALNWILMYVSESNRITISNHTTSIMF